jgi:hypothetical protein
MKARAHGTVVTVVHRCDGPGPEDLADDCCVSQNVLLGLRKPVEASGDDPLQRLGKRQVMPGAPLDVELGELLVRGLEGAGVLEGLTGALLSESSRTVSSADSSRLLRFSCSCDSDFLPSFGFGLVARSISSKTSRVETPKGSSVTAIRHCPRASSSRVRCFALVSG